MQQKDRELAEKLKGFDAVWKRVGNAKTAQSSAGKAGVQLMPGKNGKKGRGRYHGGVKGG